MNSKGAVNIFIIAGIIAAALLAGYFFLSQKVSIPIPGGLPGALSLTPRATEKDFEFIEDPTLRKHFVAQANQTTYRTKVTSPGSGLTTLNEVQIKGDSYNFREIESDGPKERKHMITIGDTLYLKDYSDNKWWRQTAKPAEIKDGEKKEEPTDFKEEYSKPDLKYKASGKESCGSSAEGLTCFKYEQIFPESPDMKRIFWFDDNKYLLRKDQAGFGEFIATVEYSYDVINIQAPSPTKDVPEGKSIYEYSSEINAAPSTTVFTKDQVPQIPANLDINEGNQGDTGDY